MSMHYVYIECATCNERDSIYTGDVDTEYFDSEDWEGEIIVVPMCKRCKEEQENL